MATDSANRSPFPFEAIGHRGLEGLAVENSLAAFEKAISLHVARVEFDVQQAGDGELIVYHERLVDVGKERVPVASLTREELLHATGRGASEIPRLEDVLNTCASRVAIQLELKVDGIEAGVNETLGRAGFAWEDVCISSFEPDRLGQAAAIIPLPVPWQLVLLVDWTDLGQYHLKFLLDGGFGTVSIKAQHVSRDIVAAAHAAGLRIIGWGLRDNSLSKKDVVKLYASLIMNEVDGFTCAYPDIAQQVYIKHGLKEREQ
jgi:glycerophosphoryl diester phosphodiesterase